MLHENTRGWDTCGCVIVYVWEDANPDLHITKFTKPCEHHKGLPSHAAVHQATQRENQTKNNTLRHIAETHPELTQTVIGLHGQLSTEFHPDKAPTFGFTGERDEIGARTLRIEVPALAPDARQKLHQSVNALAHIEGKVVIA